MRRCTFALVACTLATVAEAEPAGVGWEDLVGAYQGRLAWKGCNTPGARQATVALDAIDGALAIDLTPAGGGLRGFTLAPDAPTAWSGQQGDVSVRVVRPRANTLELAVTIDDRCEVRGTLTRTTTRIASCDRLLAWSRIEQRCTKRTGTRLEDVSVLALEERVWAKLPARRRKQADASCTARAEKLSTAMIEVGCAPVADPETLQLGAACQRLVELGARVERCAGASPELLRMAQHLTSLAVPGPDPASREVADRVCADAQQKLVALALNERCEK